MRRLLAELFEDLGQLEKRIAQVTREIEGLAARDQATRRLMTVPGIGPLAATALLAAADNGQQFRRARDMAAWLDSAATFDRRKNPDAWHKQARQSLCPPAADSRSAVLRRTSGSDTRSVGNVDRDAATAHARQQGHCCSRGKDRSHCLGDINRPGQSTSVASLMINTRL
jgi:hypothetical protein